MESSSWAGAGVCEREARVSPSESTLKDERSYDHVQGKEYTQNLIPLNIILSAFLCKYFKS